MHSALSALEAMGTQHSVPLTLQALSAECVHRVWSHVPVSPADLPGPLSLSLPLTRALPRLDLPVSVLACDVRQLYRFIAGNFVSL